MSCVATAMATSFLRKKRKSREAGLSSGSPAQLSSKKSKGLATSTDEGHKDLSTAPATNPPITATVPPVGADHDLAVIDDYMEHFNQFSKATLLKAKADELRSLTHEEVSRQLVNNAVKVRIYFHSHLLYFFALTRVIIYFFLADCLLVSDKL